MPFFRYHSKVTSSGAKIPFCASASAIMLATVFRYGMGSWRAASTNSTLMPCACAFPHRRSRANHVLAADPGPEFAGEDHATAPGRREIDVARRPAEAELGAADADADRAIRAVGAAMGVGARDEGTGHHEALLGEIEMEDPVARGRVVRLVNPLQL